MSRIAISAFLLLASCTANSDYIAICMKDITTIQDLNAPYIGLVMDQLTKAQLSIEHNLAVL